jgi:uncharacterized membrane protein AbrB (regulator of aidB expression)
MARPPTPAGHSVAVSLLRFRRLDCVVAAHASSPAGLGALATCAAAAAAAAPAVLAPADVISHRGLA